MSQLTTFTVRFDTKSLPRASDKNSNRRKPQHELDSWKRDLFRTVDRASGTSECLECAKERRKLYGNMVLVL